MGVTIRDVARRAEVSISTVSRVLNDTCPVGEEKRRRVLEAAATLGYSPHPAALSLQKRATRGLGVLLPFISGEFFAAFLNGIDQAVQKHGYFLMVSASHRHESEFRAALKGMYRRVDGLLIMAPEMVAEAVQDLLPGDVPVVFVNTRMESKRFDGFNVDDYGGMYAMTRHLLEHGHRRIAFLKGPEAAHDARDRLRAYRDALAAHGGEASPALELEGDFSIEAGYQAVTEIFRMDLRPTAIIAANDQSAQGALSALLDAGVEVPEEIALGGFDDIPSARFMTPSLSSVRVPIRELGVRAIDHLMKKIRGEGGSGVVQGTLPVELVVRASTGTVARHPETGWVP